MILLQSIREYFVSAIHHHDDHPIGLKTCQSHTSITSSTLLYQVCHSYLQYTGSSACSNFSSLLLRACIWSDKSWFVIHIF
ncbi:hypothetical protein HOF65_04460 [bacterium]|nr:hypothetical protein [bacterium]